MFSGEPTDVINQVSLLRKCHCQLSASHYLVTLHSFIISSTNSQHLLTHIVDKAYINNRWSLKERELKKK